MIKLETESGEIVELKMYQEWPVRIPRPIKERKPIERPLITGQRVLDTFFPVAKGGTAAIPGGFGTGKTMTQHQLAKWSDADIIVYIGCGERGNEMTEVLEEFPKLIDPKSGQTTNEQDCTYSKYFKYACSSKRSKYLYRNYNSRILQRYGISCCNNGRFNIKMGRSTYEKFQEDLKKCLLKKDILRIFLQGLQNFMKEQDMLTTLKRKEGSVTIIGAVSPPGGDFSEPVTENTKRYVSSFLGLDKKLAYARHYPAINWLSSYSGYIT